MSAPVSLSRADVLLDIVQHTVAELHQGEMRPPQVFLDSTLDRDLGLDSLARVELFARIEHAFHVRLPAMVLEQAETPRELLVALERVQPALDSSPQQIAPTTVAAKGAGQACPPQTSTMIDALAWQAARHPSTAQITLCTEVEATPLSYAELWRSACKLAAGLQDRGIKAGDTVALMLATSIEYFYSFFGVMLAGAVPVPMYPPLRRSQLEEHVLRHGRILENAGASLLITMPQAQPVINLLRARAPALQHVETAATLLRSTSTLVRPIVRADSMAFLQYTSGSTGQPKGVMLTHANLLANIRALGSAAQVCNDDIFVSWLPLYHDMGLIGACLGTLYFGVPLVLMSPISFLARPVHWLRMLQRYRGTLSAAPNFAYEMCATRIHDDELAGLDLSSWRIAWNGAEAVMPATIERFRRRFAPYGFRSTAQTPVYGLAESSVGLTFPPLGREPLIDVVERDSFMRVGIATPARPDEKQPLRFVSCGRPLPNHEVRVVDESGNELAERIDGSLQFKGPSATQGYYRNVPATQRLIHGEWLESGDRAYIAGGEVFITGRVKDIIIRAGRHIYPDELEDVIGELAGVRKGCVAAFPSIDPHAGTERLIVMAETRLKERADWQALRERIVERTVELLGEPPDAVLVVEPHTILKTSSGKIRRAACRELYEAHHGKVHPPGIGKQWMRLCALAMQSQWRRVAKRSSEWFFGVIFWLAFVAVAIPAWLLTAASRSPQRAWSINHKLLHRFVRLMRISLTIEGLDQLPSADTCVVVVNHSSYLDSLFLVATLPRHFSFVAKRELQDNFFARVFLNRIGAVYVERFERQAAIEGAAQLIAKARAGRSYIMFPEGTFTRAPGLRPFHLGAFAMAADANLAVIPIAIRGSRSMLRDGRWLPHRGAIVIHIAPPIVRQLELDRFDAAVKMRDAARACLLQHCGEPDLA